MKGSFSGSIISGLAFAIWDMSVRDLLVYWKDALAAVQSIVTIAAVVVGGVWAYFKVFKGRVYHRRLEPSIKATILRAESYLCAAITVSVKNVGLTRVDIDSSAITVNIYAETDYEPEFHNAIWDELGIISAFKQHSWVEPGEVVTEELLVALPNKQIIALGFRLRLLPAAPRYLLWRRRTEWNALAVASLESSKISSPALAPARAPSTG